MRRPVVFHYPVVMFVVLIIASCSRIDPDRHPDRIVMTVAMGKSVYAMSPTPDGSQLYVSQDALGDSEARMMTLRAQDYAAQGSFPCGYLPLDMLFLPSGQYLYVADDPYLETMGRIWVVDVAASRVAAEIPTGRDPGPLAATPDSRFVYVGSAASGRVLVVGTEENRIVDTLDFPYPVGDVEVSPDGSRLYVSAWKIYVLQASDNAVVDSIAVGRYAVKLAILPDGTRLYASTVGDAGLVYAIDVPGNTVGDSIVIGRGVDDICLLPDGRFVYTASHSDSSVQVVRTSDDSVVERIQIGFPPTGLKAHPDGSRVYITGYRQPEFIVLGS